MRRGLFDHFDGRVGFGRRVRNVFSDFGILHRRQPVRRQPALLWQPLRRRVLRNVLYGRQPRLLENGQMLYVKQRMCLVRKVRQQFVYRQNMRGTGIFYILPVGIHKKQRIVRFGRRVLYLHGDFGILLFGQPVRKRPALFKQPVRRRVLQHLLYGQQPHLRRAVWLLHIRQPVLKRTEMLKQQVRFQNLRR